MKNGSAASCRPFHLLLGIDAEHGHHVAHEGIARARQVGGLREHLEQAAVHLPHAPMYSGTGSSL